MVKTRKPMHVDPYFENKMKELQRKVRMKEGNDISLRELTAKISKDPNFEAIEQGILDDDIINFNIKFDKRRKI